MSELELRLTALRDEIAWPETPAFEPRSTPRRARRAARLRPLALGFAILLVVLAGVLAFSPGARSAFLEIFSIRGATVERVESCRRSRRSGSTSASGSAARRPSGGSASSSLDLGGSRTRSSSAPDGLARGLRRPVAKPRLVLSQARGGIWDGFIKKAGSSGTTVDHVTVDGERGLFIDGDEHFVMFLDGNGRSATSGRISRAPCSSGTGPAAAPARRRPDAREALELANSIE